MSRLKPTEVRLIADLLLRPAEDADGLAASILQALEDKRAKDTLWSIVYFDPNSGVFIPFGPFGTEGAAKKVLANLSSPGPKPARGVVLKLRTDPA